LADILLKKRTQTSKTIEIMKKITFTIILILICKIGFSQTLYSNYLDITSEWRNISGGWNGFSDYSNYTTTYFDGFETINGKVYYKQYSKNLYSTTTFSGTPISELTLSGPTYVREDATGKFYRVNPSNLSVETIFFDNQQILNTQVGDIFPYPGAVCNVQSIETIYLGSIPLKKINGSVISTQTGSIEGIGHIGLACGIGNEYASNLNCYSKQGVNIQFGTVNCNSFPVPLRVYLSVSSNLTTEKDIKIYPNPSNGNFKIKSLSNLESEKYKIYDICGLIIKEGIIKETEEEIDITNYSNGIYIIKIIGENSSERKKIIKE
jgi:Secretion system C-terminal sorting domain